MIFSASWGMSGSQSSKKVLIKSLFLWSSIDRYRRAEAEVCEEGEGCRIRKDRYMPRLWYAFIKGWAGVGKEGIPRLHLLVFVKILPFSPFSPHRGTIHRMESERKLLFIAEPCNEFLVCPWRNPMFCSWPWALASGKLFFFPSSSPPPLHFSSRPIFRACCFLWGFTVYF